MPPRLPTPRLPARVRKAVLSSDAVPPIPGKCNAMKPDRTRCAAAAGLRTDHVGTGLCWRHDASATDTIQRYRGIRQETVAKRLRLLHQVDRNVLDLIPDVQLARTMLVNLVEEYEELREAILSWARTGKQRPPSVPDISAVLNAIEVVSRIVERVHKMQSTGSITLDTFRSIMEQMGVVVARHVTNGRALDAIEAEWATLVISARGGARSPRALPTTQTQSAPVGALAPAVEDLTAPPAGAPDMAVSHRGRRRRRQGE